MNRFPTTIDCIFLFINQRSEVKQQKKSRHYCVISLQNDEVSIIRDALRRFYEEKHLSTQFRNLPYLSCLPGLFLAAVMHRRLRPLAADTEKL